jgi:hypothetical protein
LPKNLSGGWITYNEERTAAQSAPAWQRLLLSIRPWGEVGSDHGKMKLDPGQVTLSGAYLDNERWNPRQAIPDRFGLGITGGIKF